MSVRHLRERNLLKAISGYKKALMTFKKEKSPIEYSRTHSLMGIAYGILAGVRDSEKNIQLAIKALEEALTIFTREAFPVDYALTQSNLGNAYRNLAGVRDPEKNIQLAIKALEEALTILTERAFPLNYARIQNTLQALMQVKRELQKNRPVTQNSNVTKSKSSKPNAN